MRGGIGQLRWCVRNEWIVRNATSVSVRQLRLPITHAWHRAQGTGQWAEGTGGASNSRLQGLQREGTSRGDQDISFGSLDYPEFHVTGGERV